MLESFHGLHTTNIGIFLWLGVLYHLLSAMLKSVVSANLVYITESTIRNSGLTV
jgi:hypothetical protein